MGGVRGVAWCLVVGLGACGLLRAFRGRGLGVAAGPCFRGFLPRVVSRALVAPLRRSGGVRGGVVAWAVPLGYLYGWACRRCGFGRCGKGKTTNYDWR